MTWLEEWVSAAIVALCLYTVIYQIIGLLLF